jgi:hypothetical protein
MFQSSRLIIGFAIGLVLSALVWISLEGVSASSWDAMSPSTCLATDTCFCEGVQMQESLRQPANTVSSFGFVLVGLLIMAASLGIAGRSTWFIPIYGVALGFMAVIVGIGSAFYHASLTFTGQFFDILGMYLMASFVLVYPLQRLYSLSYRNSIALYITLNLILTGLQILIPDLRRYTFAIVLIVGLVVEFVYLRRHPIITARWLYVGLGLFTLAYGIWILDNSHALCAPDSLLQGHAIWHLLGACATGCLFLYYASEEGNRI